MSEIGGRRAEVRGRKSEDRGRKMGLEEYPVEYYSEFLEYVKGKYEGQYRHGLPREMVRRLVSHGHTRTYTDGVKGKR